MKLSKLPYGDGYGRAYQCVFGGLNENLAAGDGEIAAMENMTSDHYPLLSPRGRRYLTRTLDAPHGLAGRDRLCWADGTGFYYDGELKGQVEEGDKRFYFINHWIVIWPDKKYYNTATETFGSLEASVSTEDVEAQALFCSSAAPNGSSSENNCLVLWGSDMESLFSVGDAVTISGCTTHEENDRTLIVRDVSGSALYFYDNSFTMDVYATYTVGADGLAADAYSFAYEGTYYFFELSQALTEGDTVVFSGGAAVTVTRSGVQSQADVFYGAYAETWLTFERTEYDYAETGVVTVSRTVPDLDYLCECDNRLWGVKGSMVYCSYLGEPRVWNNYDGTATCCWSVEVGSGGAFTGACAYGGYPLLFKEDHIYRVYGTKPSNFQLMDTETLGCEAGSGKSFAVVGQTLYYKSRAGFAAYAGGVPSLIDSPLGAARRKNAVAGTDGRKYYVCAEADGETSLYVYDTVLGLWHREDAAEVMDFAWCGGELYMLLSGGGLWQIGRVREPDGTEEETVGSMAEFADFYDGTAGRKTIAHLYFRVQTEQTLRLFVSYDGAPWQEAGCVRAGTKAIQTLHLIPRRCDSFRVRLEGEGDWKLWALSREYLAGSVRG